ncbi:uncharacterized protein LOC111044077 isoform X2 [Nilaparvata lugens]|uniref:uncharacterized protein LOC111044077 isoform X2 n=1 Tax=Nilaparvata lugens TaxID=108931 RepID=UPI00193CE6F2|nr:uncharacterized protein LOC111044077 isoform X2 [Nilaparvata lugens]
MVDFEQLFNLIVYPTPIQHIYWQNDLPYYHFGSRRYICHQGKDTNIQKKRKYEEERDRKAHEDSLIKRYNRTQITKKLDCPASIIVTRVIRIPEHKVSGNASEKYKRLKAIEVIKKKIENGEDVGEEGFFFNMPTVDDHKNHFFGKIAALTEPVDSRVSDYINQLITRGERNAVVISKQVQSFVESDLQGTDQLRRRFYPNLSTVKRIISSTKSKLKSQIDQDQHNVEMFVKGLDEDDNYKDSALEIDEGPCISQCKELPSRGSNRTQLINECNSTFSALQTIQCHLEENDLKDLNNTLKEIYNNLSSKVSTNELNGS